MEPALLVADEPVASLDVSLQAQIVNLLDELRERLGLTLLFISHDLALVGHISSRVAVMYAGAIVEEGEPATVLHNPAHPYTRALLAAIPRGIQGRGVRRGGTEAAGGVAATGCRFAPRCAEVADICRRVAPPTVLVSATHRAACHFAVPVAVSVPEKVRA
jgi:oligopeptide/dipeptide ABC transporter ATP-binding protein